MSSIDLGKFNYVAYLLADTNGMSIKVAKYDGLDRVDLFFDDRIEITSFGSLPQGMTENEFFEGYSVPRNKELMRLWCATYFKEFWKRMFHFYGKFPTNDISFYRACYRASN